MAKSAGSAFTRSDRFVLTVCCVVTAALVAGHWRYTLDDTYIYLQFARNLLGGGGPAFNAGEPVYGFTSPAWLGSLTMLGACGVELTLAAKLLGALSTLGGTAMVFVSARRWIAWRPAAYAAAFVWAGNAWWVRWSMCGVETPLAVLACLAAMDVYCRERSAGRLQWSPILLGVAYWVRPEAALLGALMLADLLIAKPRVSVRQSSLFGAKAIAVALPWLAYAFATFHTVIPTTFAGKSGSAGSWLDSGLVLSRCVSMIGATSVLEALCVVGLVLPLMKRHAAAVPRLFIAWPVALMLVYSLANATVLSRYVLVALPGLVIAGWSVFARLAGSPARSRWAVVGAVLVLAQNQAVIWAVVKPHTAAFTRTMDEALIPLGVWIGSHSSPAAIVAAPDIGAVGYFSRRRVIDLAGLVTPELLRLHPGISYDEMIRSACFLDVGTPDILVDRNTVGGRLTRSAGRLTYDSLGVWRAPSLGIVAAPDGMVYTAYQVHRRDHD